MFKFEKVKRFEGVDIPAPVRKTEKAAAYDMVAAEDVIIMPLNRHTHLLNEIVFEQKVDDSIKGIIEKMVESNQIETAQQILDTAVTLTTQEVADLTKATGSRPSLISTGYKAYMPDDYSLDLYIRSSSPLKHWLILANSTGIIDGDYVDNPENEGEIFFQVINLLPFPVKISKGEILGQAKFVKFAKTDDDADFEKTERVGGFGSTDVEEMEAEVMEVVE